MKFRIKQYQSTLKYKITRKYYILKDKFIKSKDTFIERGHEKMTIMFIPHNEKNIFNFQISKFTISFFTMLFVVILITSTFAVIRNNSVKKKEKELLTKYHGIKSQALKFKNLTNSIDKLIVDIKPEIEELYELAAGSDDVEDIWEKKDYDKVTLKKLQKIRNILPEEIFTIKDIQNDIIATTKTVKTIKNFIDVRSKVVKDTPSIVSNHGHITSLFGWRRDPFGSGRDFHTGIDIAAAGGTIIRATAPGRVVMAGWGNGYGYMVRIKHKYGFETIYAHCRKNLPVRKGQYVGKGKVVGYVGRTGNTTGHHCHYEIRLGGIAINPYPYMSRIW